MQPDPTAAYWIRQGGRSVQGPFPPERILAWIAQGRVRSDMELSGDGVNWAYGAAFPELFAPISAVPPDEDTTIEEIPPDQEDAGAGPYPEVRRGRVTRATGWNGTIVLLRDRVRITHGGAIGFLNHAGDGARETFYTDISGVDFMEPSWAHVGYLRVCVAGAFVPPGFDGALADGNAVTFRPPAAPAFQKVRRVLAKRIADARRAPSAGPTGSSLDDLERLAGMRDRGVITQAEFDAKKREILGL